MKKKKKKLKKRSIFILVFLLIIIIIVAILIIKDKNSIHEDDFYLEVIEKNLNIRKDKNTDSASLRKCKIGEKYLVIDIDQTYDKNDKNHRNLIWYKIKYDDKEAYIASDRLNPYVKVYNSNIEIIDVLTPKIKYYEDIYIANSIDEITYNHLEIIDDSVDYKITHTIYKDDSLYLEAKFYKYWIKYKVEDKASHYAEITQEISFINPPSNSELKNIKDIKDL